MFMQDSLYEEYVFNWNRRALTLAMLATKWKTTISL